MKRVADLHPKARSVRRGRLGAILDPHRAHFLPGARRIAERREGACAGAAHAGLERRAVLVASPLPIPAAKADALVNGQLVLTFYGQDR